MSGLDILLFAVVPYVCLAIFVVGHIWRYKKDQFTWTTRSTQILEQKILRPGIILFHFGLLAVIGGHVLGILVPKSFTEAVGVHERLYHLISVSAGTAAGVAMTAGLLILIFRRTTDARVAATTTHWDHIALTLLLFVVVTGMITTVGTNLIGGGYDYRETVAPWFRKIFILDPDPSLVSSAPLIYQIHALSAFVLYAIWPFTRLVHAWSVPVGYIMRAPILFRSRVAVSEPDKSVGA